MREIASTLLTLGNDKRVIVCVPTIWHAKELIDMVEEMGDMSLKLQRFGTVLVLAQQSKTPTKTWPINLDSLAYRYSHVLLFWRQFFNETINSLEIYNDQYQYNLKKCEGLTFVEFFKRKFSSAFKDVKSLCAFIKKLPLGTYSGVGDDDITQLMNHLRSVNACLEEQDIDDDALRFVLGISSPPEKISLHYDEGVRAATDLKEKMNLCLRTLKAVKSSLNLMKFQTRDEIKQYLISKSKVVICTSSSLSEMVTILSELNQTTANAFDLVIVDDASMTLSSGLQTKLCLPGVRNTVLASEETSQKSIMFKELSSISTRLHELTEQYSKKGLLDAELKTSFVPFTWVGIPKHMLAPVRNQGNTGTCAFHSTLASTETHYKMEAAGDEPSRKFTIELCVDDMERLYKIFSGEELGCEISNKNKGRSRVEYALMILKEQGVLGRGRKSAEKIPVAFRISSFQEYPIRMLQIYVSFWKRGNP